MKDITDIYVRGWADRQSQVKTVSRSIVATADEEYPIRNISSFLRRMGITCTLVSRNVRRRNRVVRQWELRVGRRESLELWRDKIGFLSKEKASKLDEILASYVR